MTLSTQKRMAASILKVGESRIRFNPEELTTISSAVTREDIRKLIEKGTIDARQKKGTGRYRAKARKSQIEKGRRRGHGKRKGAKGARFQRKKRWITTIRPLRKMLSELKGSKKIDNATYRKLYSMAKGGVFKSRAHLDAYMKEKALLKG